MEGEGEATQPKAPPLRPPCQYSPKEVDGDKFDNPKPTVECDDHGVHPSRPWAISSTSSQQLGQDTQIPTPTTEDITPLKPNLVKIDLFDIEDEIRYQETVVVCFVVRAKPPLHVIDGFVRRIWKDLDIDSVGIVDKGVYMVRMKSIESRDKAYESNGVLFDNKPFVIKPWTPEMLTDKNSLSSILVWI